MAHSTRPPWPLTGTGWPSRTSPRHTTLALATRQTFPHTVDLIFSVLHTSWLDVAAAAVHRRPLGVRLRPPLHRLHTLAHLVRASARVETRCHAGLPPTLAVSTASMDWCSRARRLVAASFRSWGSSRFSTLRRLPVPHATLQRVPLAGVRTASPRPLPSCGYVFKPQHAAPEPRCRETG